MILRKDFNITERLKKAYEGIEVSDSWVPTWKLKIREELVFAGSNQVNKKVCWRCGAGHFTAVYLNVWKTPDPIGTYCSKKGEKLCNSVQKDKMPFRGSLADDQSNRRVQRVDYYDDEAKSKDYKMVLNADVERADNAKPNKKVWINGFRLRTMIDPQ